MLVNHHEHLRAAQHRARRAAKRGRERGMQHVPAVPPARREPVFAEDNDTHTASILPQRCTAAIDVPAAVRHARERTAARACSSAPEGSATPAIMAPRPCLAESDGQAAAAAADEMDVEVAAKASSCQDAEQQRSPNARQQDHHHQEQQPVQPVQPCDEAWCASRAFCARSCCAHLTAVASSATSSLMHACSACGCGGAGLRAPCVRWEGGPRRPAGACTSGAACTPALACTRSGTATRRSGPPSAPRAASSASPRANGGARHASAHTQPATQPPLLLG